MDTKVKDLSREELKALIQNAVEEALANLVGDPDRELELRAKVQERLQHSLMHVEEEQRIPMEEVVQGAAQTVNSD